MTTIEKPESVEATMNGRYLAIGALIYAVVSTLWIAIAYFVGDLTNGFVVGTAVFLIILLIGAAIFTLRQTTNSPTVQDNAAELGKWFGIIFSAEGIAIGVGSGILAGFEQTIWIVPWVALVVGLHFLPLARLLKLPFDTILGIAIVLFVGVTVLLVDQTNWVNWIAVGTAVFLWLAGWGRLLVARRAILHA